MKNLIKSNKEIRIKSLDKIKYNLENKITNKEFYTNEDDSIERLDIQEYLGNKFIVKLQSVFYFDTFEISLK